MRRRRRYREIGSALARHGLGVATARLGLWWLVPFHRGLLGHVRRDRRYSTAEHIRLALEELGPTAIKLGQILSTRPDLLPPNLVAELEKLRDRVPPVPTDRIVAVIEAELGCDANEVFEHFEEQPLAAASIGQVHAASLRDGSRVVVKVRKPGVFETVEADLAILSRLARRTQETQVGRHYDVEALVDEFAWTLRSELDYSREARNADRLRTILANEPRAVVPRIHERLSTGAVLVMERLRGTPIADLAGLDRGGIDRAAVAATSAEILMKQVFEAGFFHADPHPGNFLVLPDGRVGLLDFGMVGRLEEDTKRALVGLLMSTVRQDALGMTLALESLGILFSPSSRDQVRRDLARMLDRYYGLPIDRFDLADYVNELLSVVRRNRLQLPADLALVLKTVGMSDGLWRQLDPGFNPSVVAERFAREVAGDLYSPASFARRALQVAAAYVELLSRASDRLPLLARGTRVLEAGSGENPVGRHSILVAASNVSTAIVAGALIISLTILTTVYRPPGWPLLRPLLFFGGAVVAVALLLRVLVARRWGRR